MVVGRARRSEVPTTAAEVQGQVGQYVVTFFVPTASGLLGRVPALASRETSKYVPTSEWEARSS
jgi:hypothetical protein